MKNKKILLVHGWDYLKYTSGGSRDAWQNRSAFRGGLEKSFYVESLHLPGFCGEPDPQSPWTIDDYASFLNKKIKAAKPDFVLGYSFGGAVVLRWKNSYDKNRKRVFLVSPAILRKYEHPGSHNLAKLIKKLLPENLQQKIRDFYLIKVIRNQYYALANQVMRQTYRNIVSVDLRGDLIALKDPVTLIFGKDDSATPFKPIQEILETCSAHQNLKIINGNHDIANTNTNELVSIIVGESRSKSWK